DNVEVRPGLHNRLKDIADKLDVPPLKPELRKFVDWVSGYTLAPRGMVLRMTLRRGEHLGPARERVGVRLPGPAPARVAAARGRARAGVGGGRAGRRQGRGGGGGGCLERRGRWTPGRGHAGEPGAAARAGGAPARSGFLRARLHR